VSADRQQSSNKLQCFASSSSPKNTSDAKSSIVTPVQKSHLQNEIYETININSCPEPMETVVATSPLQQKVAFLPTVTPATDDDNDSDDIIDKPSPDLLENYSGHQQPYACLLPVQNQHTASGVPMELLPTDNGKHAPNIVSYGKLNFDSNNLPSARLARKPPFAHDIVNDSSINIQEDFCFSNQPLVSAPPADSSEYVLEGPSAKDYRKMVTRIFVNKKLFAKVKFITMDSDLIYRGKLQLLFCQCSAGVKMINFYNL
jgi:hypothetical protein